MESLAEAAEAAVGAAPQTQEEPVFEGATERDEACVIVGEKRARADAVTAMENKKEHLRRRLEKKIDLIEKAVAKSENKPLSARKATALEKWRRDVDAMNMELAGLEKKSEEAVVRKAMRQQAAESAASRRMEKESENRHMSEAGVLALVDLRMRYESRIANHSDTVDSVWQHIHKEFVTMCDDVHLPRTDARGVGSLRSKFSTEQVEFRNWAKVADRAMKESGVSADEVVERVDIHRRPSTKIFYRYGWHKRPMSQPPFTISGGSAATLGDRSAFANPSSSSRSDPEPAQVELAEMPPVDHDVVPAGEVQTPTACDEEVEQRNKATASSSRPALSRVLSAPSPPPLHIGGTGAPSASRAPGKAKASLERQNQQKTADAISGISATLEKNKASELAFQREMAKSQDGCTI